MRAAAVFQNDTRHRADVGASSSPTFSFAGLKDPPAMNPRSFLGSPIRGHSTRRRLCVCPIVSVRPWSGAARALAACRNNGPCNMSDVAHCSCVHTGVNHNNHNHPAGDGAAAVLRRSRTFGRTYRAVRYHGGCRSAALYPSCSTTTRASCTGKLQRSRCPLVPAASGCH